VSDSPQQPHFANVDSEAYRENFQPGDHILVDVREHFEWDRGHLPGAIHIPLGDLPDSLDQIPKNKPVVVVCAAGHRSVTGSEFLLQSGYTEVYSLSDGTNGWIKKGFPIEN
jgi:hydroxyacylglutathione hydrolase